MPPLGSIILADFQSALGRLSELDKASGVRHASSNSPIVFFSTKSASNKPSMVSYMAAKASLLYTDAIFFAPFKL